jgi:general secretion pathway protein D
MRPDLRRGLARVAQMLAPVLLLGVPAAASAQQQPQRTTLNFADTRLADVIRSLAQMLGINVVLSDVPDRRISFSTTSPVRPEEIGSVLESILEANGLVLVQKGVVAQIVKADSATPTGQVRYGTELPDPPPLGLITQLVPLQSIRADEGAATLRQVASPLARIEPVARSNALLITDRGVNVARYLEILRRLDEKPAGELGLRTYVVPLKYADAEDLAGALAQLFGSAVVASRAGSIEDLSLSRNLGAFRQREYDTFRSRQGEPLVLPPTSSVMSGAQGARPDTMAGGAQRPGALVGQTTVVPSLPTNALIIRTVPPNFPLLQETIQSLDERPAQVLFEVTVAEITLGKGDEFGVDWSVAGGSTRATSGNPFAPDTSTSGLVVRVMTLSGNDVRAVLRAVATRSNVKVLSTPEVLAVNNRAARIVVGSKVPFVASTRLGDVAVDRSVQYQDVGTTLTIVPSINQDNYVSVQILQEVSALTTQTIQAAFFAPVISTREASTRAIIRDGQTVVIGGLIGDTREDIESGVPIVKDIPIVGNLFKTRRINRQRTEVAIFVTPYILRSDEDADALRNRLRERMNRLERGTPADTTRRRPD